MKFKYKFVTETIEIDVDEEWVTILEDMDRLVYNNDHKETRRHYHLDACEFEGNTFAVEDPAFERFIESDSAKAIVTLALSSLSEAQRQLIDGLFFQDLSVKEYAALCGVSTTTIYKAKKAVFKMLHEMIEW